MHGRPENVSSTWFAHVTFSDAGEGLLSITSKENRNGTLTGTSDGRRGTKKYQFSASWCPIVAASSIPTYKKLPREVPSVLSFSTSRRLPVVFHFPIPIISFAAFGLPFTISSLSNKEDL